MDYKKGDEVEFKILLFGSFYETTGQIHIYESDEKIIVWKVQGLGGGKLNQRTITKADIIKKV
jgi:hypothetical protein